MDAITGTIRERDGRMSDYWEELERMEEERDAQEYAELQSYKQGRAEGESIGITRVLDILESLDKQILEKVKDKLYEQDYNEQKEKR